MSLCVLTACVTGPASTTSASWPMYRGDFARDGHPAGSDLGVDGAARLRLSWAIRLDGAVDGTPAIAQGVVVVGTAGGTLAAVDARSGRELWSRHGLGPITSSVAVDGGLVYTASLHGRVYAFDMSTGRPVWELTLPGDSAIWASPVAYRDEVIIGVASPYGDQPLLAGRLYGLDAATGRVVWMTCLLPDCAAGDGIWSTPAIDSRGVAFVGVGNPADGVLAFDPRTGQRKWLTTLYPDRDRDLDVGASPLVFELGGREVIAQATVEGMFAVLDASSGAVVWTREVVTGSAVHGLLAPPAYDGADLFAVSAGEPTGMFALAARDGSIKWSHLTTLPVYSAPIVGAGVVVFGTGAVFGDLDAGSLVALSAADGRVIWDYDTHSAVRSGPAFAGETLVAGDYAGDLMAFRPGA